MKHDASARTAAVPQQVHISSTAVPQQVHISSTAGPQQFHSRFTSVPQQFHSSSTVGPQQFHGMSTSVLQQVHSSSTAALRTSLLNTRSVNSKDAAKQRCINWLHCAEKHTLPHYMSLLGNSRFHVSQRSNREIPVRLRGPTVK